MKQTITNPNEVDWLKYWQEALKQKTDKNKDWDKAAPHFHKRAKKDDCLDSNLVVDTINQLYGNIEVNKLKTSIKFDDDTKAETIDLLDDRIYDRENFEYNKENPITHERIVNTLRLLYKNKKKNLIK